MKSAASGRRLGPRFPGPFGLRVAFAPSSLQLHAVGAPSSPGAPKSPQGRERPRAAALLGLPALWRAFFADTQSGDEASASLGVGVWVGGRRSRSWRVWGVELVFRTRVLKRFAPKHRSKLGGVAADSRRPHSPANWGVASCQPRWGQVRLPKLASSRPASLPRRATCGGRWRGPS